MAKAIASQHPAVVLRSHYRLMRALLAVAMVAVIGLSVAIVILATDGDDPSASSATPIESINYGGFNPGTGRPDSAPQPQDTGEVPARKLDGATDAPRHDGGPEESPGGPGPRTE
jgi:hypothetical protein